MNLMFVMASGLDAKCLQVGMYIIRREEKVYETVIGRKKDATIRINAAEIGCHFSFFFSFNAAENRRNSISNRNLTGKELEVSFQFFFFF